jgi:hypothetical protein
MSLAKLTAVLLLALPVMAAEAPLPQLRIEPTGGGSIFYIHNAASEPLTAFLIELVNYPGSYYAFWQDDVTRPVAPGADLRIQVGNMIVGAAPDYVKMRAALFADGSSSGIPEKVTALIERRRSVLATTRELIGRLEKGASAGDLKQWAASIPEPTRANRTSQPAINQAAAKSLIMDTAARLDGHSAANVLADLRASERALAASKPAL